MTESENPKLALQTINTKILEMIVSGKVDIKNLAKDELNARGLNRMGTTPMIMSVQSFFNKFMKYFKGFEGQKLKFFITDRSGRPIGSIKEIDGSWNLNIGTIKYNASDVNQVEACLRIYDEKPDHKIYIERTRIGDPLDVIYLDNEFRFVNNGKDVRISFKLKG